MRKLVPVLLAVALCLAVVWRADVGAARPQQTQAVSSKSLNDTIDNYCGGCHNDVDKRGELSLEHFDVARAAQHPQIAEKMIRKLRTGLMPPKTEAQPDRATRMALVTALESAMDMAAASSPNPGRRVFQRLNRAEYAA